MITIHLHLELAKAQAVFMSTLRGNIKFTQFLESRKKSDQIEINKVLRRSSLMTFQAVDMLLTLTIHFHNAYTVLSWGYANLCLVPPCSSAAQQSALRSLC